MTKMRETPSETPAKAGFWGGPRAAMAALGVSVAALILAAAPYAMSSVTDDRIHDYLLRHPEVLQEMSNALQTKADNTHTHTHTRPLLTVSGKKT